MRSSATTTGNGATPGGISTTPTCARRRAEAGERIAVTAHGRVVAELVPPGANIATGRNRYDQLVAAGVIRPAIKKGPLPNWPSLKLPPGTAKAILDWSRGED